ncbi:hypothetical protein BT63DRAFT_423328 [Microthyrium microscopicum]|uniref:Uncharacterized protein n=1 Tax=Microthyrium microscopicum TaxID=703497 RepID=A0A6A6UI14_9PEZI|nr:hypothetical protein BT63DRAFT_423328 [Microthyrium microscopicum]
MSCHCQSQFVHDYHDAPLRYSDQIRQVQTDRGCDIVYRPSQVEKSTPISALLQHSSSSRAQQNVWQTKVYGAQLVNDGRPTQKIQLVTYLAGTTSLDKAVAVWVCKPSSFSDLVQIALLYRSYPLLDQVPHVMSFPEFTGYPWRHRWPIQHRTLDTITTDHIYDQILFQRIIRASFRTQKSPLCAPDYFFYSKESRQRELEEMFQNRGSIKEQGHKWNLSYTTTTPEQHADWWPFFDYVKKNIPTGEFLFEPYVVWDKIWFARTIVETAEFPVREEVLKFVTQLQDLPQRPSSTGIFKSLRNWSRSKSDIKITWSEAEKELIEHAAMEVWTEWRQEAERKLDIQAMLIDLD